MFTPQQLRTPNGESLQSSLRQRPGVQTLPVSRGQAYRMDANIPAALAEDLALLRCLTDRGAGAPDLSLF